MSTCEENDDLLNIFNLISNIKEDLRKLKLLEIPSDENGITKIKVYISRIIQDLLDTLWYTQKKGCPKKYGKS